MQYLVLNRIFSQLTRLPSCVCVNTMYIYQYSVKHLNQKFYKMQSESFITWIPPEKKKRIGILQVNKKSVCTVFIISQYFIYLIPINTSATFLIFNFFPVRCPGEDHSKSNIYTVFNVQALILIMIYIFIQNLCFHGGFFYFVLRILCKHVFINGSFDFHKAPRFDRF